MKFNYVAAPLVLAMSLVCAGQSELPSAQAADPSAVPMSVDDAVAAAFQANPEIQVTVRRLSLATMKTATARSLDDPMLMVRDWQTPLRQPWDLNQAQLMFSVQQTLLSKQKRDVRARLAMDDVDVASSDLDSLRQEVAVGVRKVCADLKRNTDEMRLHDRQLALLKEALAGVLAQYTTGKVPQADVLRAQMALTRLNEHLIELNQERDSSRAQLNTLMGRHPDEPIEISGDYAAPADLPSLDELDGVALEHRPELASLRTSILKARDEGQAARLAMKPDFTVGLGYMLMPTGSVSRNAYMAELSMNLPKFNRARHDGETRQADTATEVAQSELEARASDVFLEVRQAQIETSAAEKRVKIYRDTLLPQAEASFKASTSAYENNRADFQTLIESQNLLLEIETAYYQALAATDAGIARLERAIGTQLPITSGTERTSK